MTVYENVAFGLKAGKQKSDLRQKVNEALGMVRLQGMEDRYPHQLSGGQQQRVAFARAVAVRPGVILFDEPLSALDAVLREEMRIEMMSLVRDMGLTALYVTHDQIEAMSMSDEIVVMQKGRILQREARKRSTRRQVIRMSLRLSESPTGSRLISRWFVQSMSPGTKQVMMICVTRGLYSASAM